MTSHSSPWCKEKLGGDVLHQLAEERQVHLAAARNLHKAVFGAVVVKLFHGDRAEAIGGPLGVVGFIRSHAAPHLAASARLCIPSVFHPVNIGMDVLTDCDQRGVRRFAFFIGKPREMLRFLCGELLRPRIGA